MLKKSASTILFFILVSFASVSAFSQDEASRQLWDTEFLKKRAGGKTTNAPRKNPTYRRTSPKTGPEEEKPVPKSTSPKTEAPKPEANEEKAAGEVLGVTIWKLRPPKSEDNKEARLLLQDESSSDAVEWTPERVEAEMPFSAGDRVRLGIESPRDGYLYVIDREQYADGSSSDSYLIFPTLRNRGGDNAVKAGKLIELPARSAFRLKPLREDYRGEFLTVIVSDTPLKEIAVGPSIIKLDAALVSKWERDWRVPFERYELEGGAGKPYTKSEKEAGMEGARLLTQEDDLPQTLYRIMTKPGQPLLVSIPLRIK
jgi:hypothetical protein